MVPKSSKYSIIQLPPWRDDSNDDIVSSEAFYKIFSTRGVATKVMRVLNKDTILWFIPIASDPKRVFPDSGDLR